MWKIIEFDVAEDNERDEPQLSRLFRASRHLGEVNLGPQNARPNFRTMVSGLVSTNSCYVNVKLGCQL